MIRFAVVGLGHIGKRHADMILRYPQFQLAALVDADENLFPSLEARYRVPVFASLSEMKNAGVSTDVVCVCTPNGLHAEHTLFALEMLDAHVVCEKPFALSTHSALQMIQAAENKQKEIFCVVQNRYSEPAKFLKKCVVEDKMGKVFFIQINCFWNRDERYYGQAGTWRGKLDLDGGPLFTQFSHFIDILYWIFGGLRVHDARLWNFNHLHNTEFEDSGTVNFETQSGVQGTLQFSTSIYDQNYESSILIVGEKGTVKMGGQYMEKIEYCHVKDFEMPQLPPPNPANDYGAYKGSAANHHFIFEAVRQFFEAQIPNPLPPEEGYEIVRFIEDVHRFRKD